MSKMVEIIFEQMSKKRFKEYFLALDVGGTATTIGIIGIEKNKPTITYLSSAWTNEIGTIIQLSKSIIETVKKNIGIKISGIALCVAGAVNYWKKSVSATNVKKNVEIEKLRKETKIKKIVLLNDFEALGYGVNAIKKTDLSTIRKGKELSFGVKGVIGPGTGLGKTIAVYDKSKKYYHAIPTQGGNTDMAITSKEELELLQLIKKKTNCTIQEELVSGRGIENIYEFLKARFKDTKYTKEIEKSKHKIFLIEKYKKKDPRCKEAFKMFSRFFGRIVKNFAIDSLPYGGIYIAGGISMRNPDLLGKEFLKELNSNHRKQIVVRHIPVYLIKKKELSLLGAAYALVNDATLA